MVVPKSFSISRAEDFFLANIVFNVRLGFETDTMEGLVRIEGIAGMGMEVTEKGLEVNHTVFGSDHSLYFVTHAAFFFVQVY